MKIAHLKENKKYGGFLCEPDIRQSAQNVRVTLR